MYFHMEAFKRVDIIVTPTTGYDYLYLLSLITSSIAIGFRFLGDIVNLGPK